MRDETYSGYSTKASDLPDAFDAREEWGDYCPSTADIYDQSACGDCWAVATVTAATDRK